MRHVPRAAAAGTGADAEACAASSRSGLTPRQAEVLALLLQGMPNKLIARELNAVGRNGQGPCGRGAARAGRQLAHAGGAGGEPDDAGQSGPRRVATVAALTRAERSAAARAARPEPPRRDDEPHHLSRLPGTEAVPAPAWPPRSPRQARDRPRARAVLACDHHEHELRAGRGDVRRAVQGRRVAAGARRLGRRVRAGDRRPRLDRLVVPPRRAQRRRRQRGLAARAGTSARWPRARCGARRRGCSTATASRCTSWRWCS